MNEKHIELQDLKAIASIGNDIVLYGPKDADYSKIETKVLMVKFAPYIGKPFLASFQRLAKFSPYKLVSSEEKSNSLVGDLYLRLPNEVLAEIFQLLDEEYGNENQ